jgi:tRNA-2-methylthio-N6-dimethylallyladenosine synthase
MVGSIQRCLVTGLAKRSPQQLQARTECNRVINFNLENISFIGKLVDIEVTEALSYSLLGTLHNPRGKN